QAPNVIAILRHGSLARVRLRMRAGETGWTGVSNSAVVELDIQRAELACFDGRAYGKPFIRRPSIPKETTAQVARRGRWPSTLRPLCCYDESSNPLEER